MPTTRDRIQDDNQVSKDRPIRQRFPQPAQIRDTTQQATWTSAASEIISLHPGFVRMRAWSVRRMMTARRSRMMMGLYSSGRDPSASAFLDIPQTLMMKALSEREWPEPILPVGVWRSLKRNATYVNVWTLACDQRRCYARTSSWMSSGDFRSD
jgi:hypothetical protein